MRGLVICWILIGVLGYFGLPWYVTGDGFFSINWLLEYSLADYGSALSVAFVSNKYWLLPIAIPLLAPLFIIKLIENKKLYSKIFIYSGLIGIFYIFLQGFSIGIRGWNYEIFYNIFGEVNKQYGIGSGAVFCAKPPPKKEKKFVRCMIIISYAPNTDGFSSKSPLIISLFAATVFTSNAGE